MDREIKFRAWDKDEDLPEEESKMWYDIKEINFQGNQIFVGDYGNEIDCNINELMQFTELKDKNGKEIYEGDIVKGRFIEEDDEIYTGECIFEYGHFCIKIEEFFKPILNSKYQSNFRELEVLGNKFENPELLKNG